jgi:hypothetical protein
VLYGAWQSASDNRPPRSHIFASPTSGIRWEKLDGNGWDIANAGGLYWLNGPVVDPRSTPSEHKLLTANLTNLQGLYELTARWEDGRLAGHSWQRILYYELDPRRPDLAPGFDHGWERYGCKPRTWQYAPLTWGRREIWSSLGQKLFAVDSELAGFTDRWQPKYTRFVGEVRTPLGAVRTYTSRGVQCTYNTDMAAHENYVITCQADNGIVESWDHGASWSIERRPNLWFSNASAACALLEGLDPPLVVAHECRGFGASGKNGSLQVKALSAHSPVDRFLRIAGGEDGRAGMPFAQYRSIATDPRDPKRVYVAAFQMGERWDTGRSAGVWLLRDVPAMLQAAEAPGDYDGPAVECITTGTEAEDATFNTIFVDPRDSNVLWGSADWTGRRGLWKATNRDGHWDWEFVMGRGQGTSPSLAVWEHTGSTCIALGWAPEEGGQHVLTLSTDGGTTWRTVLEVDDVIGLRPPTWLLPGEPPPHFSLTALAGRGDRIYCTYHSFRHGKPLGLFRGIIRADGSVMWDDFTDGLDFPVANRMRVIENDGARWLYIATRGTGCWRRRLGDVVAPPSAPRAADLEEPVAEEEAAGESEAGEPVAPAPAAAAEVAAEPPAPAVPLFGAELWCKTVDGPAYGETFAHPSRALMLEDGVLTVDLTGIEPLQIATLKLPAAGLEAGRGYTFSCEISAERAGGVILTLPEPHPDGDTDSAGKPMSRPAWLGVRREWRPVSEGFTFTPGVSSETVSIFFDAQNAGAVVRIRNATIRAQE